MDAILRKYKSHCKNHEEDTVWHENLMVIKSYSLSNLLSEKTSSFMESKHFGIFAVKVSGLNFMALPATVQQNLIPCKIFVPYGSSFFEFV